MTNHLVIARLPQLIKKGGAIRTEPHIDTTVVMCLFISFVAGLWYHIDRRSVILQM